MSEEKKNRPAQLAHAPIVYTRAETREHEEEIAARLPHETVAVIVAHMRAKFGIGKSRVKRLIVRVRERWVREDEASGALQVNRAEAIRRVKRMIKIASGRRAPVDPKSPNAMPPWAEPPNHGAVARYEHILANLQGTYTPVKVDVDVRVSASIQHVVSNLTAEQVSAIVERQRSLRELEEREKLRTLVLPPAKAGSR